MAPNAGRFELPPLLEDFLAWLEPRKHPALGYFEVARAPIEGGWFAEPAEHGKLAGKGTGFLRVADGSQIAVIDPGGGAPMAVVYFGSEGGFRTLASSPEELLLLLAQADTGVMELDEAAARDRDELAAWLKTRKIRAPKTRDFDLGAFLEPGAPATAAATGAPTPPPPASGAGYDELSPATRRLATFMGRRADDPELAAFVTGELKKKVPSSLAGSNQSTWVTDRKKGVELLFQTQVLHPAYPPVPRSKKSFVPYLSYVVFKAPYRDELPSGIEPTMSREEAEKMLGKPHGDRGHEDRRHPFWRYPIDPQRGVVFEWFQRHARAGAGLPRELRQPQEPGRRGRAALRLQDRGDRVAQNPSGPWM